MNNNQTAKLYNYTHNDKCSDTGRLISTELKYTEYDAEGNEVGTGTEVVTAKAFYDAIICYDVTTWDGVSYNAKGTRRKMTDVGVIRTRREYRKFLPAIFAKRYPDAADIVFTKVY